LPRVSHHFGQSIPHQTAPLLRENLTGSATKKGAPADPAHTAMLMTEFAFQHGTFQSHKEPQHFLRGGNKKDDQDFDLSY